MPHLNNQWRRNGSRKSAFHTMDLARDLHELLEIPLDKLRTANGKSYDRTLKGESIIRAVVKAMVSALQRGETVTIQGFGSFKVELVTTNGGGTIKAAAPNGDIIGDSKVYIPTKPKQKVVFYPSVYLEALVNLEFPNVPNYNQKLVIESWKSANEDREPR